MTARSHWRSRICDKPSNAALNDVIDELDVVMSQRVRSRDVEVGARRNPTQERHLLGERAAVAWAGGTALVAAMATSGWPVTRFAVTGLFSRRRPARQATIEAQLDAHALLVSQAENSDEVRQGLAAIWQLELAALLHQHPEAKDDMRALIVRVWEALPTAQQTWMRINIARNQTGSVASMDDGPGRVS